MTTGSPHEPKPLLEMRPFLLNLRSEANELDLPHLTFDEALSVNLISESGEPLAGTRHLLATQTKTDAVPESDDDDVDFQSNDDSALSTLTKTAAEKENDDSD